MRRPAPVLLAAGLLAAGAAPAHAATGRCLPDDPSSPVCHVWSGKVTFLADGDTMTVRITGVGERRVRVGGINATELTRYSKYPDRRRGECHGVEATARVEGLLRGAKWRVRLAAQRADSMSGKRLRRAIFVRRGGRWVDVGGTLAAEGHALWLPSHVEWAFNRRYAAAAASAAARRLRIWNPQGCGAGPSATVTPGMSVVWDAPGNDLENIDGEVMRVSNPSGVPLPVGGWWVRDSSARRFKLPAGTTVPPGGEVDVHVGTGAGGGRDLFWGLGVPAFENVSGAPRFEGDGAYLFDPRGNLRAFDQYQDGTRGGG